MLDDERARAAGTPRGPPVLRACLCISAAARVDGGGAGTLGEADGFRREAVLVSVCLCTRAGCRYALHLLARCLCTIRAAVGWKSHFWHRGAEHKGMLRISPPPSCSSSPLSLCAFRFFPGKGGSPQSSAAITRIQRCAFCDRDGRGGRGCRESAEGGGGPGRLRFSAVLVLVSAGPAGGEPELFIAASALIGFMSRGCRHRGSLRLCLASWKSSVCASVHAHTCARAFD